VLDKRTDLLCEQNLLWSVDPCSSVVCTQILEELGLCGNLFDDIKERDIAF
jgi:hypothetical protein